MSRSVRWRRWVLLGVLVIVVAVLVGRRWVSGRGVESDSWVLLDLDGAYAEEVNDAPLARLLGEPSLSLLDLLLTIRDAGEDPRVAGLVVRIRPLAMGWGKAQEIRAALDKFRASGKPLHAYLELELSGGSMEYYVASVADRVHVPPGAAAPVTGLLAQYVFLGGVWEKLDVDMQVLKIREYKTSGDMLVREDHDPVASRDGELAARQHVRPARRRHRDEPQAEPAAVRKDDRRRARDAGGVAGGGVGGRRAFLDELRATLVGADGKWLGAEDYAAAAPAAAGRPAVRQRMAVIYGVGPSPPARASRRRGAAKARWGPTR